MGSTQPTHLTNPTQPNPTSPNITQPTIPSSKAKDVISQEPLMQGQAVRFHLYEDRAGLGAEQCYVIA